MSPSAAAVIIFDQVQTLMQRHRLPFNFTYSEGGDKPIDVTVHGGANRSATLLQMATIECAGHAERFGAEMAHALVREVQEGAKKQKPRGRCPATPQKRKHHATQTHHAPRQRL